MHEKIGKEGKLTLTSITTGKGQPDQTSGLERGTAAIQEIPIPHINVQQQLPASALLRSCSSQ